MNNYTCRGLDLETCEGLTTPTWGSLTSAWGGLTTSAWGGLAVETCEICCSCLADLLFFLKFMIITIAHIIVMQQMLQQPKNTPKTIGIIESLSSSLSAV